MDSLYACLTPPTQNATTKEKICTVPGRVRISKLLVVMEDARDVAAALPLLTRAKVSQPFIFLSWVFFATPLSPPFFCFVRASSGRRGIYAHTSHNILFVFQTIYRSACLLAPRRTTNGMLTCRYSLSTTNQMPTCPSAASRRLRAFFLGRTAHPR